jgi:hypothetical protein
MLTESTPAKRLSITHLLPADRTPVIRIDLTFFFSQRIPAVPDENAGESGQK